MPMADFKQRFGLDWRDITNSSATKSQGSEPLPAGLEDALIAYGSKVTESLNRAPSQTLRIFDIAKELGLRIDTLLPLISYLVGKGYIERVADDPLGNDTVRLKRLPAAAR